MSVSSNYYLDSASLATATRVFADAELTICAPDGYYSDGSIVRLQTSCILGNIEPCPSCFNTCSVNFLDTLNPDNIYYCKYNVGTDIGAISIKVNSGSSIIGIIAEYNGVTYSNLVSESVGYLVGVYGEITYIGLLSSICFTPPQTFNVTENIILNNVIYSSGATININVDPTQVLAPIGGSAYCYLVIPKINAVPSEVNVTIVSLCSTNLLSLDVFCPAPLSTVQGCIDVYDNPTSACGCVTFKDYYVNYVNGGGGVLGLYDMVFEDENGQTPLVDGYYKSTSVLPPNDWFQIENGVVINFGTC